MKKYTQPAATTIRLITENMIANSLNDEPATGPTLSNQKEVEDWDLWKNMDE